MKASSLKQGEPAWHLIDAKERVLGRLATEAASLLRGKGKVCFVPYLDCGDHVVVINAKNIVMTGNKINQKEYYRHSWYPGGLRVETAKNLLENDPAQIIFKAVRGMLPSNKIRNEWLKKLHIYEGSEHPHQANIAGNTAD